MDPVSDTEALSEKPTEKTSKGARTTAIWIGIFLSLIARFIPNFSISLIITIVAIAITLYGCYLWTQIKNRHWAFMFWGILTPIGLLGISLLEDKSVNAE